MTEPKEEKQSFENKSRSILEVFSGRMKETRKQRGFTQQSLADAIPVSIDTIKRYESSKYAGIDILIVDNIAKVLEVPVWTLFKAPEQSNDLRQAFLTLEMELQAVLEKIK